MAKIFTTFVVVILLVAAVAGFTAAGLIYLERDENRAQITELTLQKQNLEAELAEVKAELADITPTETLDCYSQSDDGWLVINTPCQGQALTETIEVKGVAFGFFENNVVYKLMDGDTEIDRGSFTYTAEDIGLPGVLNQTIELDIPASITSLDPKLVFYEQSAMDGSEMHVVEIDLN